MFTCRSCQKVWGVVCGNLSGNETSVLFSILPWRMQSTEPCSGGLVAPSPNSTLAHLPPLSPRVSTSRHPASYLQSDLYPSLKREWWAWKGDARIIYTPCVTGTFNISPQYFQNKPCMRPCLSLPKLRCTPLLVYDPVWCSSFMCQFNWATGYPTRTTGQVTSVGMSVKVFWEWDEHSNHQTEDSRVPSVLGRGLQRNRIYTGWQDCEGWGIWRYKVQSKGRTTIMSQTHALSFSPLPIWSEATKRMRKSSRWVDSFSKSLTYLPGARNKKQATQTFSSAHSPGEESLRLEKENLSTHWLYIIFY